jgi:hypothetical protein
MKPLRGTAFASIALAAAALLAFPSPAHAHCDTMDGPVVVAAQLALETGELDPMLIWVREEDEPEIRHAFDHVRRVRATGSDARALADRFFFETVVRIHREGEGAAYTGLKPAGTDLGEVVPAADHALAHGTVDVLRRTLHEAIDHRLDALFGTAAGLRDFAPADVAAGRAYVEAYVALMHFVEAVEAVTSHDGHGEHGTAAPAAHGH